LLDEAFVMQSAVLAPDHVQLVTTLDLRGYAYSRLRNYEAAETAYAQALAICAQAGLVNETCSRVHNNRGQNFYRQNRLVEAEAQMRLALAQRRQRFGEDHMTVAISMSTLGNVLERAGRIDEAAALQRAALGVFERLGMTQSAEYALISYSLAMSQNLAGQHSAALTTINQTLALWRRAMPEGKAREFSMLVLKVRILTALKQPDAASEIATAAMALNIDPARINDFEKGILRAATGKDDLYHSRQ
jgi:tetratricopeptide (TPR) repeat protein